MGIERYAIPNGPVLCEGCGVWNDQWSLSEQGPHYKASGPSCGKYAKFIGKKDLGLETRSCRSSDLKPSDRTRILTRDGYRCVKCGRTPPEVMLHIDHIVPVDDGGSDDADNLITCCEEDNLGKGKTSSIREQFILWLRNVRHAD